MAAKLAALKEAEMAEKKVTSMVGSWVVRTAAVKAESMGVEMVAAKAARSAAE